MNARYHSAFIAFCLLGFLAAFAWMGCGESGTAPENQPPNTPSNPDPPNNAVDQPVDVTLSWSCSDPDGGSLKYSVYFGTASDPPLVSSNQSSDSYTPEEPLTPGTKYYWKIRAKDSEGAATTGPIWNFTTLADTVAQAPTVPSDPDPADGAQNVSSSPLLSWESNDPNGDPVVFDLYFGTAQDPPLYVENLSENHFQQSGLAPETQYYWKITASDGVLSSEGPVWSFRTAGVSSSNQVSTFGSQPRWSPDGQKLAFGGEGYSAGIWVYDVNTGALTQITDSSHPHLFDYRWSPDGSQIAFGGAGSQIEGTSGIFTVGADGSGLTRRHETGQNPDWLADGSGLIFAEYDPESAEYGIYKLTFSPVTLTQITDEGIEPQVSPAGDKIAYRSPGDYADYALKVVPLTGGPSSLLADDCLSFVWSYDGSWLIYDVLTMTEGMTIYKVASSGGSGVQLAAYASQPSISQGGQVAYQRIINDLSDGIWLINLDGSNNHQVNSSGAQPSITPDGSIIACARSNGIWLVYP